MLLYDPFYKRYGLRLPQMFMTPQLPSIEKFEFPRDSLHHFVVFDGVTNGPSSEELLYKNIPPSKKIMIEHVKHLEGNAGNPKVVSVSLSRYITAYQAKHKRFRLVQDITQVSDPSTLCVVNYAFAVRTYRYNRSAYTEYFKWFNIEKTIWNKVQYIAKNTERNQFIFVAPPKVVPSLPRLNTSAKGLTNQVVRNFSTPESLFLLEIWKWLSIDKREESVFSDLTPEELKRVNIVYVESGHWAVLNLGVIDSWRYIKEVTDPEAKIKLTVDQLQKRYLRLMMTLISLRTEPVIVDETEDNNATIDEEHTEDVINNGEEEDLGEGDDTPIVTTVVTELPNIKTKTPNTSTIETTIVDVGFSNDDSQAVRAKKMLDSLDDDLKQLEIIEAQAEHEISKHEEIHEQNITTPTATVIEHIEPNSFGEVVTPEMALKRRCEELAEEGVLSALAYKRLMRLTEETKNVKSPYKDEPLHSFSEVKQSEVAITAVPFALPDTNTVLDKSMLQSSLLEMDKKYIKEILPKDITGMVVNTQKAGFAITKYEVEKVEDALSCYEQHSVRISPIEGTPSTIRFKLPVVDDEGVYKSNGISYRLRKQRSDAPIRKISPSIVALTTYYGKTFVSRSAKKVNDYGVWLTSQVMLKGLEDSDNDITNLAPANVFDNKFKSPRAYSILATSFKSFTSQGYDFFFDHTQRELMVDEKLLNQLEHGGRVLIATNAIGNYLVMDQYNAIYEIANGVETVKGTIEAMLNIPTENAPVEFTEVKVFGKEIPVGIVLGYLIGLEKLFALLRVTPRRVPTGTRVNLQDFEYALVFSDETLIFERDNRVAALVLAGFHAFEKTIRNYSVYTFDKRGVYLSIMDTLGTGARYVREIELMDSLFIDPISLTLLQKSNEPTSFRGLLVKATQMLLTDDHPDALDMNYMRIKGYERLSGAVYAEIVQSIRDHKAKGGRATAAIDLHPYAVWKRITQDPSVGLVSDINPIKNLKEQEAVTFSGTGGRSGRSMVRSTRAYHPNDMGVISESTVDSSDVGINTFLSANPQFDSLYGTSKRFEIGKSGISSLLSTSALLAPGSDRDDAKRVRIFAPCLTTRKFP